MIGENPLSSYCCIQIHPLVLTGEVSAVGAAGAGRERETEREGERERERESNKNGERE